MELPDVELLYVINSYINTTLAIYLLGGNSLLRLRDGCYVAVDWVCTILNC